jgi:hypothetical protein
VSRLKFIMKIIRATILTGLAAAASGCTTVYPNPATPYVQRTDTVTFGAGNAQAVNAAAQTIDPWPRYVGDRRIPGNGSRMVGAVERYEGNGRTQTQTPGGAVNTAGSASPAGATGAPALYPLSPISPGPGGGSSSY